MIIVHQELKNVAQLLKCHRLAVLQMRDRGLRAIAELSSLSAQTKLIPEGCIYMICEQADNKADAVLLNGDDA